MYFLVGSSPCPKQEYAFVCLAAISYFLLPWRQNRMSSALLLRHESQHNLLNKDISDLGPSLSLFIQD